MTLADAPGEWPVVATADLHRDDWVVALRRDRIHAPGHPEPTFGRLVVEHPGAVLVLAIDADERVCLVRQYRHPGAGVFVELPAGICDVPGEDPVETGRRELREEASLEADEWQPLLTSYPSVGISTEVHHLYLARGLRAAAPVDGFTPAHEEAHLEVVWAPYDDLLDAVLEGRVREAPLALAVLAYQALRARGEL